MARPRAAKTKSESRVTISEQLAAFAAAHTPAKRCHCASRDTIRILLIDVAGLCRRRAERIDYVARRVAARVLAGAQRPSAMQAHLAPMTRR